MIFQGLFNILDLYFNEIDIFYNNIDSFFHKKIEKFVEEKNFEKTTFKADSLRKEFKAIFEFLSTQFVDCGFRCEEFENKFPERTLKIRKNELELLTTPINRYEKKAQPIIYEIFLEKIVEYLVGKHKCESMMLNLKSQGFLPIEFIVELRSLRNLFEKHTEKLDNLKKYIEIREKIVKKFTENKEKIESLQRLENPQEKLQLVYLLYKIIDFFNLQYLFDFSHIKNYIENNIDEWLVSIPLITLKNPDLYYCGLYLADRLDIKLDMIKIKDFLLKLYEENIDEFDAPFIEATDRLYYYFKSTHLVKLKLSDDWVHELVKEVPKYFESEYLKNMETSQLAVMLKLINYLGLSKRFEDRGIKAILEEIENRISSEGIKQYRDGFFTSEATYYVLFSYYMRNSLDKLKDYDFLNKIISRIYRNLELLDFSGDTNYDLVSELFYSVEVIRLINCIETKQMLIILAKYLFPDEVVKELESSEDNILDQITIRYRDLKVNSVTGDTIY